VKLTQADCDHVNELTAAKFGDLVPEGRPLTPEMYEQLLALAGLLEKMSPRALAGACAGMLLEQYGKAAPLVARRMVEVFGEMAADP
jgi:hypothetical protein